MISLVPPNHPILQERAAEVPVEQISSIEVQNLIDQMLEIAKGERKDLSKAVSVGLAAPQVGIGKRIILVAIGIDFSKKCLGELTPFINPRIEWVSSENALDREGCYSVDSQLTGIVSRAERIRFVAYDRFGRLVNKEFSGLTARICQHEVDHLQGVRFPDRIGENGILHWVGEDQFPEYRLKWASWPHSCSWDTWIAMKEGRPYECPSK